MNNEEKVFISDLLCLDDELENLGVFNAIVNSDSNFFINITKLKNTKVPEFINSYDSINKFFEDMMILLDSSERRDDKFFNAAKKLFPKHGLNEINLGHSKTGIDAGFGNSLVSQVINDAFDIVKKGSKQPEIFHLVGLFEENVASDRLSDMIANIMRDDIIKYTKRINTELKINSETYPELEFKNGILINPYKKCELLYVPIELLHEIPIAKCWSDIDRVVAENEAIRNEINIIIGEKWKKYRSHQKKAFVKEHVFKDPSKCKKIIDKYKAFDTIEEYDLRNDFDYLVNDTFRKIKKNGTFNVLIHGNTTSVTSFEASMRVLNIFKDWVENNKGWDEILVADSGRREKFIQRLLHLSGKEYCKTNNIDMSFESNGGRGPVDLKISRGTDKTVIEIKLSSNPKYMHGYERQIEEYAKSENTENRIFVFVDVGNGVRKEKLIKKHKDRIAAGENPPELFIIDSTEQKSASLN